MHLTNVLGGHKYSATITPKNTSKWFGKQVQDECDKIQQQKHCRFAVITNSRNAKYTFTSQKIRTAYSYLCTFRCILVVALCDPNSNSEVKTLKWFTFNSYDASPPSSLSLSISLSVSLPPSLPPSHPTISSSALVRSLPSFFHSIPLFSRQPNTRNWLAYVCCEECISGETIFVHYFAHEQYQSLWRQTQK